MAISRGGFPQKLEEVKGGEIIEFDIDLDYKNDDRMVEMPREGESTEMDAGKMPEKVQNDETMEVNDRIPRTYPIKSNTLQPHLPHQLCRINRVPLAPLPPNFTSEPMQFQ